MAEQTVATQSLAYQSMASLYWAQIDALRGTSQELRDLGETYLPRHRREETQQWEYRRDRSFLYGAYDSTVRQLAARPFVEPVTLPVDLPERLAPMVKDMDLAGRSLTTWCQHVFEAGVHYGLTHVLVDGPNTGGVRLTVGQEQALGVRPACVHYSPPDVIAWRTEDGPNGQTALSEVRLREVRVEPDGDYGDVEVTYYRVLRKTEWELWRQGPDDDEPVFVGSGTNTLGKVPLVTLYTGRTGYMTAKPPMWPLADLNMQHWQVGSDYANILHVNMVPFLSTSLAAKDIKSMSLGAYRMVCLGGTDEWIRFVEHSGAALGAGREELDKLEARMRAVALEPYISGSGTPTATGRAIDEAKGQAPIRAWIHALESVTQDALALAAEWTQTELPADFRVQIYSDFAAGTRATDDARTLGEARGRGDIDQRTYLAELRRRGILAEGVNVDDVVELARSEGPDPADFVVADTQGG